MVITMRIFNSDSSSHLAEIAPRAVPELLQEYSKQEDKHHYKQARLALFRAAKLSRIGWKG